MSEVSGPRHIIKHRIIYTASSPAGSGAQRDARVFIEHDMKELGLRTDNDDAYYVESHDDEVWFWFEYEEKGRFEGRDDPVAMAGHTLPVAIPVVGCKGESQTDADRYRTMASRITNGSDIGGDNTRRTLAKLLHNVAASLDFNAKNLALQDAEKDMARAAERAREQQQRDSDG